MIEPNDRSPDRRLRRPSWQPSETDFAALQLGPAILVGSSRRDSRANARP